MTKPFIRFIFVVVVLLTSIVISPATMAQRGQKSLSLSAGYASFNNSGYTDISFQYSFSKNVRIAPTIGYVYKKEGKSAFTINLDVQFPFKICQGIQIYPLTGVTFNDWTYKNDENLARFGLNAGAGVDLYITSNLKFSIQGKYSFMNDTDGAFGGIGIGYVF